MKNNHPRLLDLFHLVIICLALASLVGIPKPATAIGYKFASPSGTPTDECSYTDPCDLQTAVNTSSPGGLVFVAAGTYHPFSLPSDQVLLITQNVHIYGGWDGVSGPEPVPNPAENPTILDGQNARQGVTIMLGLDEIVTFSGFTVRNGNATGKVAICSALTPAGCGGGIMVAGGTATIEHCIIEDNVAATTTDTTYKIGYGGGIYVQNGTRTTIKDNIIRSNDASTAASGGFEDIGIGGGIFVSGVSAAGGMTISGNEISGNNTAALYVYNAGKGAGLAVIESKGSIDGNIIHDNDSNQTTSLYGSGLYSTTSDLSISKNLFIDNRSGAVLYLTDHNGTLSSNVIINPLAGMGIIMSLNSCGRLSVLTNNIIARHTLMNVHMSGSIPMPITVNLYHNTIDGGQYGLFQTSYSHTIMASNIISNASVQGIHKDGAGNTVDAAFTLFTDHNSDAVLDANLSPLYGNPLFVDAAGGDYHIQSASPARDHAPEFGYFRDFEGDPRPIGSGGMPFDIGADEYCLKYYMTLVVKP